jgi:hypothetical protein
MDIWSIYGILVHFMDIWSIYGLWVYFMNIWSIYGILVYFMDIWYILRKFDLVYFSRFGILHQEKSGNPGMYLIGGFERK